MYAGSQRRLEARQMSLHLRSLELQGWGERGTPGRPSDRAKGLGGGAEVGRGRKLGEVEGAGPVDEASLRRAGNTSYLVDTPLGWESKPKTEKRERTPRGRSVCSKISSSFHPHHRAVFLRPRLL